MTPKRALGLTTAAVDVLATLATVVYGMFAWQSVQVQGHFELLACSCIASVRCRLSLLEAVLSQDENRKKVAPNGGSHMAMTP